MTLTSTTADGELVGRELARALVADLNSGHAGRIAKARKTAPAIDMPAECLARRATRPGAA